MRFLLFYKTLVEPQMHEGRKDYRNKLLEMASLQGFLLVSISYPNDKTIELYKNKDDLHNVINLHQGRTRTSFPSV
jgi:hypothetical protein